MRPILTAAALSATLSVATLAGCTDQRAARPGDPGPGEVAAATRPTALANNGDSDCGMRQAFTATDANTPGGRAPVWGPAQDPNRGPALFAAPLNVNTDGT